MIVTVISLILWPGWLKWCPVALVKFFITHITTMFRESLLQWPFALANILLVTSFAANAVHNVSTEAVNSSVDVNSVISCCWLDTAPRLNKGADGKMQAFFIPGRSLLGLEDILGGTLALINLSLMFGGLLYIIRGGAGVGFVILPFLWYSNSASISLDYLCYKVH